MRIAICGTAGMGKSTLVSDFIEKWKSYRQHKTTYRDIIKDKGLEHSAKTTRDTQWDILNFMVDQLQSTSKGDKVVFDRCPLDNLAYTLWACENGTIDDDFLSLVIPIVRESMRMIDIIFLVDYDKTIPIVADGMREVDPKYILEIDAIFKGLYDHYLNDIDSDLFFPKDDCPAIIPISGNRAHRIQQIADYIDPEGDLIETKESILSPSNLNKIEALLKQQNKALEYESAVNRFTI